MTITLGGIPIPDLFFENRFAFAGVEAETERAKAGNLIVSERAIQGRAIDLGGDVNGAWMDYQWIQQLIPLVKTVAAVWLLDLHGELINVRFRHEEPPVFDAKIVLNRRPTEILPGQKYSQIKIKLMEM